MNHREEAERLLRLISDDLIRVDPIICQAIATVANAHAALAGQDRIQVVEALTSDQMFGRMLRAAQEDAAKRNFLRDALKEAVVVFQGKDCGPKYTTDDVRALSGLLDD